MDTRIYCCYYDAFLLICQVESYDDAILWLWERHNRVNARLASDRSTDPEHPKIQFPRGIFAVNVEKKPKRKIAIRLSPRPGLGLRKHGGTRESYWNS